MIHLPILRHGVPYKSLDVVTVAHYQTREPFVEISQANAGLIRRDLCPERQAAARQELARKRFVRLIAMCSDAADHFLNDPLPLGDGEQTIWDQPHEGNLFEHLYARRSFQQHADAALAAAGSA